MAASRTAAIGEDGRPVAIVGNLLAVEVRDAQRVAGVGEVVDVFGGDGIDDPRILQLAHDLTAVAVRCETHPLHLAIATRGDDDLLVQRVEAGLVGSPLDIANDVGLRPTVTRPFSVICAAEPVPPFV